MSLLQTYKNQNDRSSGNFFYMETQLYFSLKNYYSKQFNNAKNTIQQCWHILQLFCLLTLLVSDADVLLLIFQTSNLIFIDYNKNSFGIWMGEGEEGRDRGNSQVVN